MTQKPKVTCQSTCGGPWWLDCILVYQVTFFWSTGLYTFQLNEIRKENKFLNFCQRFGCQFVLIGLFRSLFLHWKTFDAFLKMWWNWFQWRQKFIFGYHTSLVDWAKIAQFNSYKICPLHWKGKKMLYILVMRSSNQFWNYEWTREGSIRKGFGSWFLPR